MGHIPRLAPVAVFLALVSLAQIQSVARVGVMWRTTVLSWDNPVTPVLEDVATDSVSTDALESPSAFIVVVDRPIGRARPVRPGPVQTPALDARISRSPPAR